MSGQQRHRAAELPSRSMPHVLVVPSWYPSVRSPRTGTFFDEQAKALADAGNRVGVIFCEQPTLHLLTPAAALRWHWQTSTVSNGAVLELRRHGWNLRPHSLARAVWTRLMCRLAIQYQRRFGAPDIIHAHSMMWGGVAASVISKALNRRYVITEHLSAVLDPEWQPARPDLLRRALQNASGVIAVSTGLRSALERFDASVGYQVIPNLVDTEFFSPSSKQREKPDEAFHVLTVGALIPLKGIDLLIRAFAAAFRGDSGGATLTIAGEGPERSSLQQLARELGIDDQVRFVGHLSRKSVRDVMRDSDLFVLASRVETFGLVLAEALAVGLPLLATKSGGPVDIVTRDVGELVPVDDVGSLAAALQRAFHRRGSVDRACLRGIACLRYSSSVVASKLNKVYADVLAR